VVDEGGVEVELEGRVVAQHQRPAARIRANAARLASTGLWGASRAPPGGRHGEDEGVEVFVEQAVLGVLRRQPAGLRSTRGWCSAAAGPA
jgi:hypothetical protein